MILLERCALTAKHAEHAAACSKTSPSQVPNSTTSNGFQMTAVGYPGSNKLPIVRVVCTLGRKTALGPIADVTGIPVPVHLTGQGYAFAGGSDNVRMPRRNESCPCGSGKRFKRCHGREFGPLPVPREIADSVRFVLFETHLEDFAMPQMVGPPL